MQLAAIVFPRVIVSFLMDSRLIKALFIGWMVLFCISCAYTGSDKDGVPNVHKASLLRVPDAVPKKEVVTRAGNKNPYTVLGKTYHLLPTSEGYSAQGTASWYGTKFHGRNTANGEVYDIRAMTAAHKTLPIPCYVRVTNTLNNRSVTVRVNDRGPFHGNRIIDLSYAAAVKLGYADRGTAPVRIEVVGSVAIKPVPVIAAKQSARATEHVGQSVQHISARPLIDSASKSRTKEYNTETEQWFLQAGAFSDLKSARTLKDRLVYITQLPVQVVAPEAASGVYRVRIGPSKEQTSLVKLQQEMLAVRMGQPFIVKDVKTSE